MHKDCEIKSLAFLNTTSMLVVYLQCILNSISLAVHLPPVSPGPFQEGSPLFFDKGLGDGPGLVPALAGEVVLVLGGGVGGLYG